VPVYSQPTIYFHVQYIGLGFDGLFKVTNNATGEFTTYRAHPFPFVSDTTTFNSPTHFSEGSSLTGCLTNFSNRYTSCDVTTVSGGAADFYVSAIP
jgi:hypothetical protein